MMEHRDIERPRPPLPHLVRCAYCDRTFDLAAAMRCEHAQHSRRCPHCDTCLCERPPAAEVYL